MSLARIVRTGPSAYDPQMNGRGATYSLAELV